ncbi:heme oxygenase-like domain-containing protein [Lentzea tibetensis]|uniref:hypothetical protein n=1 Tax=Lentzea tibetensis TaxID=2591470 RepID=UPI001645B817|nr:hypothetical protein [Lentzea tibetensis]
MCLPAPRGHTSAALIAALRAAPSPHPALLVSGGTRPVQADDDLQLALWICYNRPFTDEHPGWQRHPALAQFRSALEARWETALRAVEPVDPVEVRPTTAQEAAEWERHQAFWLPQGGYRTVMLDIDAYGSVLMSLSSDISEMPVQTLALANALSLFSSHPRLVGVLAGFLTAVDTMAGDPYAQLAAGGFPAEDVLFGFGTCHALHARLGAHVADAWRSGRSSLRTRWLPLPDRVNVGC